MPRVCHAFLSVHCSLVVTFWERAGLLAFLCVMLLFFVVVFCHFPVWCPGSVVVLDPDLCLLTFFIYANFCHKVHKFIGSLSHLLQIRMG